MACLGFSKHTNNKVGVVFFDNLESLIKAEATPEASPEATPRGSRPPHQSQLMLLFGWRVKGRGNIVHP